MPPMAALLPMSVAPRPPVVSPPRYFVGLTSTADLPMRAVCTAAAMPPDVPPKMQRSASMTWALTAADETVRERASTVSHERFMSPAWQDWWGIQ